MSELFVFLIYLLLLQDAVFDVGDSSFLDTDEIIGKKRQEKGKSRQDALKYT